jgi:starvation-inducible DNA-binding protein
MSSPIPAARVTAESLKPKLSIGVNTPCECVGGGRILKVMKTKLTHTRNSLPEKTRLEIAALLQSRLADSIDLMMQAKQAHWNVKGPNFIALHELFDKVYTDTEVYVDIIAERIVQLGGIAQGTIRAAAHASSLPEYSLDISSGHKHVAELAHAIAFYGETIRRAIALSTELEDADTADIFTEVSRGADMNLWFVEAHEQAEH